MKEQEKQQEVIIITENQSFTKDFVSNCLRHTVSESNYEILEDFICDPELADYIQAYSEQEGKMRFLVGDEWVSVQFRTDNLNS